MKFGGCRTMKALNNGHSESRDAAWHRQARGTIERWQDARPAIYNHDPLSAYAVVQKAIIDGRVYFDRQPRHRRTSPSAKKEKKALIDKLKKSAEKKPETKNPTLPEPSGQKPAEKKPEVKKPREKKPEEKPKPPHPRGRCNGLRDVRSGGAL